MTRSLRFLLTEDEDFVLRLAEGMLSRLGHTTANGSDASQLQHLLETNDCEIVCISSERIHDQLELIKSTKPECKIFVTANKINPELKELKESGMVHALIKKPLSEEAFEKAIAEA